MAQSPVRVSVLFPEQYGEAAIALGRAFIDDPPMRAILQGVDEPVARARKLGQFFVGLLEIHRRHGQPVLGVIDRGKVAAAAVIEGFARPSIADLVVSGLVDLPRMLGSIGLSGTLRGIKLMDELLRNHPPEPHIYLNFLGVDPGYQKRHYGIALLDALRALASERRAAVYLETGTEANVAYYIRAGYEVIGEMRPLGVRMWRMLQPPLPLHDAGKISPAA